MTSDERFLNEPPYLANLLAASGIYCVASFLPSADISDTGLKIWPFAVISKKFLSFFVSTLAPQGSFWYNEIKEKTSSQGKDTTL